MRNEIIKNNKLVTGVHLMGEIYSNDPQSLKNLIKTKKNISEIIKKYYLEELGSFYHQFNTGGFTGVISLVESHIAIHTWPELNYLTLDVYLCNYSKNNSRVCKKVFDEISNIFKPIKIKKRSIER